MIALLNLKIILASAPWISSLSVIHVGNLSISVSRPTQRKLFLAKICSTSSFLFIFFMDFTVRFLCVFCHGQRIDHVLDVSTEESIQIVSSVSDTVVGYASLWEVVCADFR